jgi:hypothetical protein
LVPWVNGWCLVVAKADCTGEDSLPNPPARAERDAVNISHVMRLSCTLQSAVGRRSTTLICGWRLKEALSRAFLSSPSAATTSCFSVGFLGSSELLHRDTFDRLSRWPSSDCSHHPARAAIDSARLLLHEYRNHAGTHAATSLKPQRGCRWFHASRGSPRCGQFPVGPSLFLRGRVST